MPGGLSLKRKLKAPSAIDLRYPTCPWTNLPFGSCSISWGDWRDVARSRAFSMLLIEEDVLLINELKMVLWEPDDKLSYWLLLNTSANPTSFI